MAPSQLIFALNMEWIGAPRHEEERHPVKESADLYARGMWFGILYREGMGYTALR